MQKCRTDQCGIDQETSPIVEIYWSRSFHTEYYLETKGLFQSSLKFIAIAFILGDFQERFFGISPMTGTDGI
jgi:hypothetical protein